MNLDDTNIEPEIKSIIILYMIFIVLPELIEEMGEIMNINWEAQKELHPLMVNSIIKRTEKLAFENGAIGFKCNGAGGGGSVTILTGVGYEYNLKKILIENGLTLLPCKINFQGVQTWSV